MSSNINATEETTDRVPLTTISNRKRKLIPNAESNDDDVEMMTVEPPKKKHKPSKRSSANNSDASSDHLQRYKPSTLKIIRIRDIDRFPEDRDDCDEDDDIDEQRRLNIAVMTKQDVYVNMNHLLKRLLKLNVSSTPTFNAARKQIIELFLNYIQRNNVLNGNEIITKYNGKYWLSQSGFCVLVQLIVDSELDENNHNIAHFVAFRYYYRSKIFGSSFSPKFFPT